MWKILSSLQKLIKIKKIIKIKWVQWEYLDISKEWVQRSEILNNTL